MKNSIILTSTLDNFMNLKIREQSLYICLRKHKFLFYICVCIYTKLFIPITNKIIAI